jgi:glycerol-3-phosphate dehydrogenase
VTHQTALGTWTESERTKHIDELINSPCIWDLVVVGGGITGAGIFHEASARGLKVLLVEQKDFAWGTSSRSSKMVHGGLRYLGKGQIGLAKDSVQERQKLLTELKGLVNPLPFMMGHYKGKFPGPWVFDKLLAIYDWLAGRKQRKFIDNALTEFWVPGLTQSHLLGATQFGDAVTDDSRLVMRVLHEARECGGIAINYLKALKPVTSPDTNVVSGLMLEDDVSGRVLQVSARAVVNASGAWTDELRQCLGKGAVIRPLRGSHLIVPFHRLPVSFSVSFFHPKDKRPVFVFPWEGTSVIGTTDLDHRESLGGEATIEQVELDYLLEAANAQFSSANLGLDDIISSWSGVRPVVVEETAEAASENVGTDAESIAIKPSDETREHAIWDDQGLISIAGGKLTTYRLLALEVLREAQPYLADRLTLSSLETATRFKAVELTSSKVSPMQLERLIGRFGLSAGDILASGALRHVATTDTFLAELQWSCRHETIIHLDDLLLRRARLGLLLPQGGLALAELFKRLCQRHLNWDEQRWSAEWSRYQDIVQTHYALPIEAKNETVTEAVSV